MGVFKLKRNVKFQCVDVYLICNEPRLTRRSVDGGFGEDNSVFSTGITLVVLLC